MSFSELPDMANVDLLTYTFGNQAVRENDTIYIDSKNASKVLTKGDLRQLVRQLVSGFQHVRPSSASLVVCVHAFNTLCYPALFLGIVGAGGSFTGSNPAYTAGELAHHLKASHTDFLITQRQSLDVAVQAAHRAGLAKNRIYVFDDSETADTLDFPSWRSLLRFGESDWVAFDDARKAVTTTAVLASTSGTTGLPKMAARGHRSFVAEHKAMTMEGRKPYEVTRLLSVPFFHAFAVPLALVSAIRDGATTIIMPRFDKREYLSLLNQYQVTETAIVPPLVLAFLSYTFEEKLLLRTLKLAWCAGAPLDPITQNRGCQLFATGARIVQVWGMTECGWISTFRYPESDSTGSVGRLLPGSEVKLIDDLGIVVHGEHNSGEILVRSPSVMQYYVGNEAATLETVDADGWLHTGDVGKLKDGKVYVIDRKKELIKVRGWQVAPAELEGVLLMHSDISDAAVIGVSKPGATSEVPRAYVVRRPDSTISADNVKVFLLQHLAKYKVGDCEIRFSDSIPKSVSGKILRKLLRADAEAEFCKLEETNVEIAAKERVMLAAAEAVVSEKRQKLEYAHEARATSSHSSFVIGQWLWQWLAAFWIWLCGMKVNEYCRI